MAIANGTIWEVRTTGVTGNTSGAGFNPANANGPTDLTCDANTGNTSSPVASSATYSFVAGDVGAWLYVVSGTNFIPGWYQIASVASNKATLSAAIGQAILRDTSFNPPKFYTNTSAGFATTGTPTGGTFLIDYSQQDAAQQTATDYASVGASTTLTSASAGFTRMMVGNIFHQTTTGTGAFGVTGWYEIVSYTNSSTVVLDRTPNSGTASVACTGFIGGAGRLNGLEDAMFEMIQADNLVWIKNGTYTLSAAINIASTNSTTALPSNIMGYNSVRGDTCTGANRPVIAAGANANVLGVNQSFYNLIFTGTSATVISTGANSRFVNCKFLNSSSTAARTALSCVGGFNLVLNCEMVSQNGNALALGATGPKVVGCYLHDSVTGANISSGGMILDFCIFEACSTDAINSSGAASNCVVTNCTIYGREAKMGNGYNGSNAASINNNLVNNIFYGLSVGSIVSTTEEKVNGNYYNNYFNNTTDVTRFSKDVTDLALDPQFAGAAQITGTTATTSGSVLTQSGGDFSTVTDNVDYLRVISGTGVTTGGYLITAHTGTTLTVNNALGTSSGGDVVYFVTTGHNFAIGTNLKAAGFPGVFNGSETTGYLDVGAAQRQEAGGGGGTLAATFVG